MNNQQAMIEVIKSLSGQANVLTVPRVYIDYMGSLDGGLFLSQLIYWSDRGNDSGGWFYKTYAEWEDELTLTRYQVGKQVKILKEKGLLQTRVKKANGNPTVHYLFSFSVFQISLCKFLAERKLKNLQNESEVSRTSLTETISETTTETPSADAENGAISKNSILPEDVSGKHKGKLQAGEVDETIAQFVSVTGFTIPTAKHQLKLWQTGIKEHLAEEQFSGQLPELYRCVWDNIDERVRAGELTITHPGAFTQYMYGIVQSENKSNGPVSLDQLVSAGIVEVKTIDDKVGFFWPDGTLVGDITSELIEKYS